MPDFHAPFTREELEGRGWVTGVTNTGFMYVENEKGHVKIRVFFDLNMSIHVHKRGKVLIPIASFTHGIEAAEALLKGVG